MQWDSLLRSHRLIELLWIYFSESISRWKKQYVSKRNDSNALVEPFELSRCATRKWDHRFIRKSFYALFSFPRRPSLRALSFGCKLRFRQKLAFAYSLSANIIQYPTSARRCRSKRPVRVLNTLNLKFGIFHVLIYYFCLPCSFGK